MSKTKEITTVANEIQTADEYQEMYLVLINHEEQYSLWPSYKAIPAGWKAIGEERTKNECLAYIDEVWTDMRPLSLRKQMGKLRK
ncbi:MbtH family protein [Candidatus Tisiphia endosymbiont of Stenodema calcarata]|uniref:MbtH family protein n=1 Tax=Candidatus Tisiphia endosymbiont of Stenodema calcarata TaxID=3139337 RepID=UPI003CCB7004